MPGEKCYGRGAVSVKSAREAARFGEVPEIAEQGRRCRQSTPLWRAAITQRPMFVPEGTPSRRAAGDCDSSVARPPAAGAVSLGYRTAQASPPLRPPWSHGWATWEESQSAPHP